MEIADIINTAGVSLILLAFFLLNIKKLSATDKSYHLLNLIGAGLACVGAFMIKAIPFVVLEAIWASVAFYGLVRD